MGSIGIRVDKLRRWIVRILGLLRNPNSCQPVAPLG